MGYLATSFLTEKKLNKRGNVLPKKTRSQAEDIKVKNYRKTRQEYKEIRGIRPHLKTQQILPGPLQLGRCDICDLQLNRLVYGYRQRDI